MIDVFSFGAVTSTNDVAKILLEGRTAVIITANYQFQGRGRNNKRWMGDYGGNIFLSFGIMHQEKAGEISQQMLVYQCVGCLAVKTVLQKIVPEYMFALKYPNDVYAQQYGEWRKIAGVLVENEFVGSSLKSTVLGVGINGVQMEFTPEIVATSLVLMNVNVDMSSVKYQVIQEVQRLLQSDPGQVIDTWKNELNIRDKQIKIIGESGEWRVQGYNEFGMLLVEKHGKQKMIGNGDSIRYDLS
jgi:biotin-[acetyl-CoA-carboxylase] ligase BirA-like protein